MLRLYEASSLEAAERALSTQEMPGFSSIDCTASPERSNIRCHVYQRGARHSPAKMFLSFASIWAGR